MGAEQFTVRLARPEDDQAIAALVVEGYATAEIAGSVGIRTEPSREDILARGLWRALTRNLGFLRAVWATTLLSYPRYPSGARAWRSVSSWRRKTSPGMPARSRWACT